MGITHLLEKMSCAGCSPFFVASAVGASVFGELGRAHQQELLSENLDLRRYLQNERDDFNKDRHQDQVRMMRELYELGRKYQQKQTLLSNELRKEEIEFSYFCQCNWPLAIEIQTALHEIKECYYSTGVVKLEVLIARTEVNTQRGKQSYYDSFCRDIRDEAETLIPNIRVLPRPWKDNTKSVSGIADAMNINYILRGKPTLILFPYTLYGKFYLDFAYWSFNTNTNHLLYQKAIEMPYSAATQDDNRIKLALIGIIGFIRDSYMICEYRQPAVFLPLAYDVLKDCPEALFYLESQYKSLLSSLQTSQAFQNLCYEKEYDRILKSLNLIDV